MKKIDIVKNLLDELRDQERDIKLAIDILEKVYYNDFTDDIEKENNANKALNMLTKKGVLK